MKKDYRDVKHRREVFLDFYEYHLRNRAHAGAVYYAFPFIFELLGMSQEQKLWFAYINGCTQNVVTTYLIYSRFQNINDIDKSRFSDFFRSNYHRFGWDTDRRYVKNKFEECVDDYRRHVGSGTQAELFRALCNTDDKYSNFRRTWDYVINNFVYFGRLSTFSYLEYLRIAGLNIDCDSLFLDDIDGSKSHRNGLCKVLGRDDLDWTNDNPVRYDNNTLQWLKQEGELLLNEARKVINHPDVSYFTLETTLCCYKGWHRVNRRYPNVYNDMFYTRIRSAEAMWPEIDFSIFWRARKKYLNKQLRLEDNLLDKGLCKEKQNYYRTTGEVIMMEEEGYAVTNKTWLRDTVLVVGECGVGKTWVMRSLLAGVKNKPYKLGKFYFHETDKYIIVGKYDGSTFEGSDRLSMSVMTDLDAMLAYIKNSGKLGIFEGDRFTNSKFIQKADPCIIRIIGDGAAGRQQRGSNQTSRHLKSIATRVKNIQAHRNCNSSSECLTTILELNEKS